MLTVHLSRNRGCEHAVLRNGVHSSHKSSYATCAGNLYGVELVQLPPGGGQLPFPAAVFLGRGGLRSQLCPSRYSFCRWRAGHSPSAANRTRRGATALRCIRELSDVHYCFWRRLGLLGLYGRHRAARVGEHVALAAPYLQFHQGRARATLAAHHFMPLLLRHARCDGGGEAPGAT